ncbi:MAG: hypothetical protein LBH86_00780 [Oscillospiraceae bacterium]|nr:hypothetical protein [Oscillospiraceae bacterium]
MMQKKSARAAVVVSVVLTIGAIFAAFMFDMGTGEKNSLALPDAAEVSFITMNQFNSGDPVGGKLA